MEVISPSMWRNAPAKYVFLWLVLLAGPGLAGYALTREPPQRYAVLAAGGLCLVLSGLSLLSWMIRCRSAKLVITDHDVTLYQGLFSRSSSEVRLIDVRNVTVEQSFMQRLFHVGRLGISSAGHSDVIIMVSGIPCPDEVAQRIERAADAATHLAAPVAEAKTAGE